MVKARIKKFVTTVHLWAGLIFGVQVVLWMASGVIMSWYHITDVKGETSARQVVPLSIDATVPILSVESLIRSYPQLKSITVKQRPDGPYIVALIEGEEIFLDAVSGEKLPPLSEQHIRQAAEADFSGKGTIISAALLDNPPHEYAGAKPVWQIKFDDERGTRLYLDPQTGAVKARRNNIWRLYDFFWMLHIMDYEERENHNNILLQTASAAGLIFALSGIILVLFRLGAGRYWRRRD